MRLFNLSLTWVTSHSFTRVMWVVTEEVNVLQDGWASSLPGLLISRKLSIWRRQWSSLSVAKERLPEKMKATKVPGLGTVQSLSCVQLCDPINRSTSGLPVYHQLPEFTQTYIHRVSDAIQPSHSLSSPSPSAPNASQHHSLFQWVNSSHEVARVLEFQL